MANWHAILQITQPDNQTTRQPAHSSMYFMNILLWTKISIEID